MPDDQVPSINPAAFDRVDASAAPQDFVRWMEHQRRVGPDRALELLQLDESSVFLDIGCGSGADLSIVAESVGFAVGIDQSMTMARAVLERGITPAPALLNSDAGRLPFADGSFDACWARAVLIHTTEPQAVVTGVSRVLRLGGRAAFTEPDHGTHIVSTPEIEIYERVKAHRLTTFRNPCVGRQLPLLAARAGLAVDKVRPVPILHTSLASARAAGGPFDVAVDAAVTDGAITPAEASRYLSSLEELDAQGAFVFAALAIVVAARRVE